MKTGIEGVKLRVILTEEEIRGDYKDIFNPAPDRALKALRRLMGAAMDATGCRMRGTVKTEIRRLRRGCAVDFAAGEKSKRALIAKFDCFDDLVSALHALCEMGESGLVCRLVLKKGSYAAATERAGRRAEMIIKEYARGINRAEPPRGPALAAREWARRLRA